MILLTLACHFIVAFGTLLLIIKKVKPECEVIVEGEGDLETMFKSCEKNPGHEKFIPVADFRTEHLPEQFRTEETMEKIWDRINRTVLIRVSYTSIKRPDTFYDSKALYPFSDIKGKPKIVRHGTGILVELMGPVLVQGGISINYEFSDCPCQICKKSGEPKKGYWKFFVKTATHVIFDDSEAEKAVIKCFFDSESDQEGVVTLYGVNIESERSQEQIYMSDVCECVLCVTHDKKSANLIRSKIGPSPYSDDLHIPPQGFIVSHPHGCSKRISIGKLLYLTIPIKPQYKTGKNELFPKYTQCYLPFDYDAISPCTKAKNLSPVPITDPETRESFSLPKETTFVLPNNAKYAMVYHFDKKQFTFPSGTKFYTAEGVNIPLPDNAGFESEYFFKDYYQHFSVAYDIPTCPGSSGALVTCNWVGWQNLHSSIPHCGWDGQGKCNRSGIDSRTFRNSYFIVTPIPFLPIN